jgi:hypothetical protein
MENTLSGHSPEPTQPTPAERIRAIAAGLAVAGVTVGTNGNHLVHQPRRATRRRDRRPHPRLSRRHRRSVSPGPGAGAAARRPPRRNDMTSQPDDADELALIAAGFPAYCLWRSIAAGHSRYVAQGTSMDAHPHTVITDNLAELAAALTADPQPVGRVQPPAHRYR